MAITKKYARIHPAFTLVGDGCADMPYLCIAPLYYLLFERICGYTLGHRVEFFDTLEDATKTQEDSWPQFGIIEFEVDEKIKLQKIHEYAGSAPRFEPAEGRFFKAVKVPLWNTRDITQHDLSKNALKEFERQYHVDLSKHGYRLAESKKIA